MTNVLELKSICRCFKQGDAEIKVLNEVSLQIERGEMVALLGASGSGKTTLLQIAGLLEKPDSGEVMICGQLTNNLSENQRTAIRLKSIGFIYQFHHLLPEFSALENVMMPLLAAGTSKSKASSEALELLKMVGLAGRASHRSAKLSGGEQQRVAILRAVISRPQLILADEPTGNLDPDNSELVFSFLHNLVREMGISALIATHNMELARRMDSVLDLSRK